MEILTLHEYSLALFILFSSLSASLSSTLFYSLFLSPFFLSPQFSSLSETKEKKTSKQKGEKEEVEKRKKKEKCVSAVTIDFKGGIKSLFPFFSFRIIQEPFVHFLCVKRKGEKKKKL